MNHATTGAGRKAGPKAGPNKAGPKAGNPAAEQPLASVPATVLAFDGSPPAPENRAVAVETPVNILYGTVPYAVMMATPADFEDFAAGFSLTEGVIAGRSDITGIRVEHAADGIRLVIDLVPSRFHQVLARRRAMAGRTSCGVCGIEDLASLPRATAPVGQGATVSLAAIGHAVAGLAARQTLNAATRAVHAAAWAGHGGAILCLREDVGRHNAVDKLIGALMTRGDSPASGFLVITSRCSYEMVEKAAAFGSTALVAISAPTSLGIQRARDHGITLLGVARGDNVTAFTGAERIVA